MAPTETTTLNVEGVDVRVTVDVPVTDTDEETPKEDIPQEHLDAAIDLAKAKEGENLVAGYGRSDDGYGGPYHPDAFNNPKVTFALGGAPEAAASYQEQLTALDEAKDNHDKVDLVAGSAHTTIVEMAPYRAAHATPELAATEENVAEASARKHLIVPKSNESDEDVNARAFQQAEPTAPDLKGDTRPFTPGAEAQGEDSQTATRNDPGEPQKSENEDKTQTDKPSGTAKKTTAKKQTAKKQTAKKQTANKTTAKKQTAKKSAPKKATFN